MARLNEINGKKIALDTVVFIYTLEGNAKFGDPFGVRGAQSR